LTEAITTRITILDGGTGRELRRMGAPFRQPEWSALALIEAPVFVTRVHEAFIAAGADVITTNSYAVVPFHIGAQRFTREGLALAELAGRLAREAADTARGASDAASGAADTAGGPADAARGAADTARERVLVAGSLPPICGSYRAEWFDPVVARPVLAILVSGLRPFVDCWLAETLSGIEEAELVRDVVGNDGKPLWLSFTVRDDEPSRSAEPRLRSGQSVVDAVDAAAHLGAQAVLFNCSQPEVMGAAVTIARRRILEFAGDARRLRLGVYANAFPAVSQAAEANSDLLEIRTDLTPEGYLAWVDDWIARGADIVGGCCGIGPEHIRAIRESIGVR
jgi:S-methylmethionine-dependent homocysteine/selenocysteine methylase